MELAYLSREKFCLDCSCEGLRNSKKKQDFSTLTIHGDHRNLLPSGDLDVMGAFTYCPMCGQRQQTYCNAKRLLHFSSTLKVYL